MAQARVNEPILSADGTAVVAYWAVDMEIRADHIEVLVYNPSSATLEEFFHVPTSIPVNRTDHTRLTLRLKRALPSGKFYWTEPKDAPNKWWRGHEWFRENYISPGLAFPEAY